MIALLRGKVVGRDGEALVVENQGLGFRVFVPEMAVEEGEEVTLHTHLVIRQEVPELFGFPSPSQLSLFRSLLRVEGVGPRVALSLLSALAPEELEEAVATGDVAALCRAPGVGPRLAERIVFEMRGKVSGMESGYSRAREALHALGFEEEEVERALSRARRSLGGAAEAEEVLRWSLRELARS
jgi:Holliday junction DNA helicase RuvA